VVFLNLHMHAHVPRRKSQPSRKWVTSNIFILRCSFHKTAKRLSITSLTHLLKIATKNTIQHCMAQQTCHYMAVVIRYVILLQTKRKRTTKYQRNCIVSELTIFVFKNRRKQKKSRIGLLHRNQFPEGTQLPWTIISQIYRKKKICLKSANDTNIYRLSLWYTTMKSWSCPFHRRNTTLY